MDLQLKRIRESRGIKQSEMAERLSSLMGKEIKVRTYGSWERQEVMIDLEQAYYCAMVLDCTLDDIAGMRVEYSYLDIRQEKLNRAFDSLSDASKTEISNVAQSYALDPSRRIEKSKSEDVSNKEAMGF